MYLGIGFCVCQALKLVENVVINSASQHTCKRGQLKFSCHPNPFVIPICWIRKYQMVMCSMSAVRTWLGEQVSDDC